MKPKKKNNLLVKSFKSWKPEFAPAYARVGELTSSQDWDYTCSPACTVVNKGWKSVKAGASGLKNHESWHSEDSWHPFPRVSEIQFLVSDF